MIIDVTLTGQLLEAKVVGKEANAVLAEKSRGKHFCRITGDSEWDGMAIKLIYRSVTAAGEISREEMAVDRTAVPVPAEVLRSGRLYITAVGMADEGNEILTSARMRSGLLIFPVDNLNAPGADALTPSQYEQLFALYGVLNEKIGNVSNLDTTVADALCRLILAAKTKVIAQSADGCNYSADVEGLEISGGTEIILIPQITNQGDATLAINGGEAYPLCVQPGWNVTGNDLRPQWTLPMGAGMLLRGCEYVFRFGGNAWLLQSYVQPAPEYVDMTEAYKQSDDYREHPQEYLRSLGAGKWTLDDGWAMYSTHCWEVSGTVWLDESYSTDDGFYRRTLTANGQEVVYLDSGDGVLRINGQPLSGATELDWAEMDAVIGEAMSEDNGGTGCVTEARMQAYVTERLKEYVAEATMKAYVKEYVDSTLAAIPIAEEGAY